MHETYGSYQKKRRRALYVGVLEQAVSRVCRKLLRTSDKQTNCCERSLRVPGGRYKQERIFMPGLEIFTPD